MYYYEQKLFRLAEDDENQEEELVVEKKNWDDTQMSEEYDTTGKVEAEIVLPGEDKRYSTGCSESEEPSNKPANRRDSYKKDSMESYMYETGERQNVNDACSLVWIVCSHFVSVQSTSIV